MKFRLKSFSAHLLCSIAVLTVVLGGLYLGWYRWPGCYLSNALRLVPILASVYLAAGPLLFPPDDPMTMLMAGQSSPLLAVFDRSSMQIKAYLPSDFEFPRLRQPR